MAGYTKLFSRILDSTVWREPDHARILWITLLALADKNGEVHCTVPGLADRARISLKQCEQALIRFQKPDKYSWSQEDQGRRIRKVEGGWFLINHAKYRALMSTEEQRERTRLRVQKLRENRKSVTPVTSNACNDTSEAKADTDTKAIDDNHQKRMIPVDSSYFVEIEEYFGKRRGSTWFMSHKDFALIEIWKDAGIPAEAVIRGIDSAFNNHEKSRSSSRINSIRYCEQEVLKACEQMKEAQQGAHHGYACRQAKESR